MFSRQNCEAVDGSDKLVHRNSHMQRSDTCSEVSKRRNKFVEFSTKSCQRFRVMDTPEIHELPGLRVVSEALTAVQARDVGSSAIEGRVSGQPGRE